MNPATSRRLRGTVVALVQVVALQSAALRAQIDGATAFDQATHDFRAQRYAAAYGRFARLADAGHVPSACIALLMVRDGRALLDNDWYATPDQLRRWGAMTVEAARRPPALPVGDA